jgi:O-antigen/teichoic acid export membrane protein
MRSVKPGAWRRLAALLSVFWLDAFLRRVARNASWGVAATAVEFALTLVETTLAARILGPVDYGRVALLVASIVSIKQFVDVRAWEVVTRYLAEFLEKREPARALATLKLALLADVAVGIVAFGVTVAGAGLISSRVLRQPDLQGPMAWYALTILATMVNGTAEAVLRVFDRFRDLAIRSVAQAIWHLGLVVAVLLLGGRVRALVFAYLLSDLAGTVLLLGLAARQVRAQLWGARAEARLGVLRPYLKAMGWFTGQTALRARLKLNRQLDILILGYFRSPAEVGYYRVARRLGASVQQLTDPVYFAIFPDFARAWAGTRRHFASLVVRTAAVATVGAMPGVLIAVLLAPQLIRVWVGAEYAPAVGPFRIIMVGMGLAVATFWGTPAALGSGRPGVATGAVAFGVLVNVALLALVPEHGATGAAIALLGGYVGYSVAIGLLLARTVLRQPPAGSAPPPSAAGRQPTA